MNSRIIIVTLGLLSSAAFASGKGKELCHDGNGQPVSGIVKKDECKAPNVWGKTASQKASKKVEAVKPVQSEPLPAEAPKK